MASEPRLFEGCLTPTMASETSGHEDRSPLPETLGRRERVFKLRPEQPSILAAEARAAELESSRNPMSTKAKLLRQASNHSFGDLKPPSFVIVEDGSFRGIVAKIVYNPITEAVVGAILLFNFVIIVFDTDLRAGGAEVPFWIPVAADVCFWIYVFEFVGRLVVEKHMVLHVSWNRLDFFVILMGFTEMAIAGVMTDSSMASSVLMVRVLRVVRLLRLIRALKLMGTLRELKKLIQMMLTCIRTMFWSFALLLMLMTIWSVALVEVVHPLLQTMAQDDPDLFDGNVYWVGAYSSVMRSNLTLFQTLVSGDSWGTVAVPVICQFPLTAFIFIPALVTLVFGVLNLILAVIVDTYAEGRQDDLKSLFYERERQEVKEKSELRKIFDLIDVDESGTVTYEELSAGAEHVEAFRQRLRVMDVCLDDLQQLFTIIDEDESGDIDLEEFVEVLYRMKCGDGKSAALLMKHYVMDMNKRIQKMERLMSSLQPGSKGSPRLPREEGTSPQRRHVTGDSNRLAAALARARRSDPRAQDQFDQSSESKAQETLSTSRSDDVMMMMTPRCEEKAFPPALTSAKLKSKREPWLSPKLHPSTPSARPSGARTVL